MQVFTSEEQEQLRKAIENAERNTSGEIRICVERRSKTDDLFEYASSHFLKMEMDKTAQRNGVLIYISLEDRKFAIIGDVGIDRVVPEGFWETTKEAMLEHFKAGSIVSGLETGIEMAGQKLKAYFPYGDNDVNELSDEITYID